MRDALTSLMLEIRRGLDWLENDRVAYWKAQHRRASDALSEARAALARRETTIDPDDMPSSVDQRKALEKARRRMTLVEEKLRRVRHWIRSCRHETEQLEGRLATMHQFLDVDLSRAVAALERMHSALTRYASPTGGGTEGSSGPAERPLPPNSTRGDGSPDGASDGASDVRGDDGEPAEEDR